jgi:Tol biopolymer transport system component
MASLLESAHDRHREVRKMKTRRSLRFGAVIIAVVAGLLLTAAAGGSISPRADQIAFMSTYDGEADIYSMTLTGLMNKNLTHDETIGLRTDVEPAWSPTGEYVAFQRNFIKAEAPGAQLYRVAASGKGLRPITARLKGVVDTHPSWSPDGNSIVFSSNRDGNFELYVVDASGLAPTQLTHTKLGVENLEPAWSPNGAMIVFTRRQATLTRSPAALMILRLHSSTPPYRLTQPATMGWGDHDAAWSPDSQRIAFSSDRTTSNVMRSRDLYIININGTGLTRVTTVASNEYHPTWSPYGNQLAFISDRADPTGARQTEIYTLRLPAPNTDYLTSDKWDQITYDGAYKSNPTWHGSVGMGLAR